MYLQVNRNLIVYGEISLNGLESTEKSEKLEKAHSARLGLLACVQVGGDHEHAQVALVPSGDLDIFSWFG